MVDELASAAPRYARVRDSKCVERAPKTRMVAENRYWRVGRLSSPRWAHTASITYIGLTHRSRRHFQARGMLFDLRYHARCLGMHLPAEAGQTNKMNSVR